MKGDFSRLTFDKEKHYSSVRMQQGRVQLDADWNEQADINIYQRQTLARDSIGTHGAPKENAGYEITVVDNKLTISQGRYYVNGILCENPTTISYDEQEDLPGAQQPSLEGEAGIYVAHMEAWHHHQTSVNDQNLQEVSIGGADTTTRTKIVSPVKLKKLGDLPDENSAPDYLSSIEAGLNHPNWQPLGTENTGVLKARIRSGFGGEVENRLIRVEVHNGGEIGEVTFKWSSNNGTLFAAISDGPSTTGNPDKENELRIKIIPGEWELGFMLGQWVEITDDERLLANKPGVQVKLTEVSDVELIFETEEPSIHNIGDHSPATVRQWDSEWNSENRFIKQDEYTPLGNGIEVSFSEGIYQTGDSWLIPCRSLLGNVIWAEDQNGEPISSEPHNSKHEYAPIALLKFDGFIWSLEKDLRRLFRTTTEMSVEKVSRAGDTMYGPLTIQELLTAEKDVIVNGKLEVKGEMIVRNIEQTVGDIQLGDNDLDTLTIQGLLRSVHSSGALEVDDLLHVKEGMVIGGEAGTETLIPEATLEVKGDILGFGIVPIGSVIAWHKNFAGVPALMEGWIECNGQLIQDQGSPLNGQLAPDLNGNGQFLRGSSTSGNFQKGTIQQHAHAASSAVAGSHSHSGGTNVAGRHDHSGGTNTTGNHYHSMANPRYTTSNHTHYKNANTVSQGPTDNLTAAPIHTKAAGDHSHSFSTNTTGNHSHSFSTNTTGNHSHSITVKDTGEAETRPTNMSVVWIMRTK